MIFITCLPMKRINVTVREDQYERISQEGLNASGLIRGLLDDHFGEQKIVFRVSEPVQALYQQVISNFGGDDREIEVFLVRALDEYLQHKSDEIADLRKNIHSTKQQGKTDYES